MTAPVNYQWLDDPALAPPKTTGTSATTVSSPGLGGAIQNAQGPQTVGAESFLKPIISQPAPADGTAFSTPITAPEAPSTPTGMSAVLNSTTPVNAPAPPSSNGFGALLAPDTSVTPTELNIANEQAKPVGTDTPTDNAARAQLDSQNQTDELNAANQSALLGRAGTGQIQGDERIAADKATAAKGSLEGTLASTAATTDNANKQAALNTLMNDEQNNSQFNKTFEETQKTDNATIANNLAQLGLNTQQVDQALKDDKVNQAMQLAASLQTNFGDDPSTAGEAATLIFNSLLSGGYISQDAYASGMLNFNASQYNDAASFTTWAQGQKNSDGSPAYTPAQIAAAVAGNTGTNGAGWTTTGTGTTGTGTTGTGTTGTGTTGTGTTPAVLTTQKPILDTKTVYGDIPGSGAALSTVTNAISGGNFGSALDTNSDFVTSILNGVQNPAVNRMSYDDRFANAMQQLGLNPSANTNTAIPFTANFSLGDNHISGITPSGNVIMAMANLVGSGASPQQAYQLMSAYLGTQTMASAYQTVFGKAPDSTWTTKSKDIT